MSMDFSSESFGFEDVHRRLSRGDSITERERQRHSERLEPYEPVLAENEDGEYEPVIDISYLDKPDLTEKEDQLNFLVGEVLGINEDYRNAQLEDKGEAHILALGEPAADLKISDEYAWDGLAEKLSHLKDEEGEDYFDPEKFALTVSGSLYGRHALFYSKNEDDSMELLDYTGEDVEDEIEKVRSALEEDTIESIIEERVSTEENLGEYVEAVQQMMDDNIDNEELASKIVSYTQSRKMIEDKMGKLSDAIGRDVPLYHADGEEGIKNMDDIKDVSIENYKEEIEGVAEKVDDSVDQLQEKVDELLSELDDRDEDYTEIKQNLKHIVDQEDSAILEADFSQELSDYSFQDPELSEKVEDIKDVEQKRDQHIEDLNSRAYQEALDEGAEAVEKSVKEAFGPAGARVFSRRHIKPDWNEILNEAVDAQYSALHDALDNVDLQAHVKDGELLSFDLDGYEVQLAHNLNPLSDVTLKYGQARNEENRSILADSTPDLFLGGHHGEGRVTFNKDDRGIGATPWMSAQIGTFQDPEKLREMIQEGITQSWHAKRMERGQFDSTAYVIELDTKERNGRLFFNPSIKEWYHSDLKNIGMQKAAEEFVEGIDGDRLDEFIEENAEIGEEFSYGEFKEEFSDEFGIEDDGVIKGFLKSEVIGRDYLDDEEQSVTLLGDQQLGSPQNAKYWHQMPTEELLHSIMDEVEETADGDHRVINVGDTLQGYDIYRGQHTESRGWRGVELESNLEKFEQKLDDLDLDPETKVEAMKTAAYYNSIQNPETDFSQQLLRSKELMDERLEEMIYDGAVERHDEFSGNHGNENSRHNNDDEATLRLSNFDQELIDDGKVQAHRGTDASRAFLRFGDKDFYVGHDTDGRGKNKADKMLTQSLPSNVSGSMTGDKHQGAIATKGLGEEDSKLHLGNPAMQTMGDLTNMILSGDTLQGALIEHKMDEREYVHSGETEFLLR